jgi:Contractile injection system tube protein
MRRTNLGFLTLVAAMCCTLVAVAEPIAGKPKDKPAEPPQRTVPWDGGKPAFEGVIKNQETKYTMFLPDGDPVRAASSADVKKAAKSSQKSKTPSTTKSKDDDQ